MEAATPKQQTPAALGFRLPAEWEPHEATWIGWPHNRSDWPGKFATIPWVYGEIARKLAPGEIVRILVNSAAHEASARRVLTRVGADLSRVEFFHFPTNRGWTRDFGSIFLRRAIPPSSAVRHAISPSSGEKPPIESPTKRPSKGNSLPPWGGGLEWGDAKRQSRSRTAAEDSTSDLAIVRFRFNAWAKYPDWRKDDAIPQRVAKALGCRLFRAAAPHRDHATGRSQDVVLEGGAIDTNGRGTLLATEQCLLDPATQVRNPGLGREQLEQVFRDYLGVSNVLWLGSGIAGDDTHGHVDDFCRFVNPTTVVLCREDNRHDANYRPLEENRERLQGMRLEEGSRIEVVPLPMPAPLYLNSQRLPASYANFYIAGAAVLVPTFNDPQDRVALGILADLFPDRPVLGIHAVDLVLGLGTLHCLTREQPASSLSPRRHGDTENK